MSKNTSKSVPEDPYAAFTPVMRQFLTMRDENPGAILLYRLGDFYETFFEDAVKLNRLLGLTLTRRGAINGKPIPMAGVPASTLEQYLARLVRLGQSVAICEQIGEPNAARNGMMERKIVRVVTPGTITDNALLPEKSDSVLMAACASKLKNGAVALVWLTLTSGEFRALKCAPSEISSELARISPAEILVDEKLAERINGLGTASVLTQLPEWHFDAERGEEQLKKRFKLDNLSAWGIDDEPLITAAANAILGYIEQTQREALPYIRALTLENESSFIGLDAATRRNLEISETLRGDDGPTLFSIFDRCRTSMGSRKLKHWLHHPLCEASQARCRHETVAEILSDITAQEPLYESLSDIPDIERTAGCIALRSIRPKEAAALRDAIPKLAELARTLKAFRSPLIRDYAQDLQIPASIWKCLDDTLLEEPATFLRDGDVIKSSASAELAELRTLRDNAGQFLADLEVKEKQRTGINNLRVEYNRVSGYFIEVPRGQCDKVPEDYRRRQTLKNVERFITPELKEYEDKALSAKERAAQIERSLWDELLTQAQSWIEPLMKAASAVACIDSIAAFARHAFEANWCRPTLDNTPGLEITAARHPVVEHMLEHYVPNDCRLVPGRRLLVITGPNMGGKSTYMRSIALITLLAYAGSFVPASAARLGPIDKILTRIGASDDLARGRSTFMVEMTEAATILHQATDRSLVLMDEIGRGTSTFDGLSLAGAIAQDLAQNTRSWTLFATHYFELTHLSNECPEVVNVHVSADQSSGSIVFLHDVKDGPASQSYGIAVAGLAGVPPRVIRHAKQLLQKLEQRSVSNGPQLDLFAGGEVSCLQDDSTEPLSEPTVSDSELSLLNALRELDADSLSPREALKVLYELKDMLGTR